MKNWEIEQYTKDLKPFEKPKRSLEQYMTQHDQASIIMSKIHEIEDLEGKVIADFGAGTGMLGFTSIILGVEKVFFYEIDADAINTIQKNAEILELEENQEFEISNVDLLETEEFPEIDIVITNPPFGTSKNEGIDIEFVRKACQVSKGSVYSIHKSATREVVKREFDVVLEFGFKVPFTKFDKDDMKKWMKKGRGKGKKNRNFKSQKHKSDLKLVECDLIRWGILEEDEEEEAHEIIEGDIGNHTDLTVETEDNLK